MKVRFLIKIEFKQIYDLLGKIVYWLTSFLKSEPSIVSASNNFSTAKSITTRLSKIISVAICSQWLIILQTSVSIRSAIASFDSPPKKICSLLSWTSCSDFYSK